MPWAGIVGRDTASLKLLGIFLLKSSSIYNKTATIVLISFHSFSQFFPFTLVISGKLQPASGALINLVDGSLYLFVVISLEMCNFVLVSSTILMSVPFYMGGCLEKFHIIDELRKQVGFWPSILASWSLLIG